MDEWDILGFLAEKMDFLKIVILLIEIQIVIN